jgi:hypothetical protein
VHAYAAKLIRHRNLDVKLVTAYNLMHCHFTTTTHTQNTKLQAVSHITTTTHTQNTKLQAVSHITTTTHTQNTKLQAVSHITTTNHTENFNNAPNSNARNRQL